MLDFLGLLLLLTPFLLLSRFSDKRLGFAYILSGMLFLHLFVAIFLQTFSLFTYGIVFIIHGVIFAGVVSLTKWTELYTSVRNISESIKKIDWIFFILIPVALFSLLSVHYNYSGQFSTLSSPEYQNAENKVYPYPYYSDEWYAVSLIKDSTRTGSLPLNNPLSQEDSFVNLEFPFHSLLAEIMLLLKLDPLMHYTIISAFVNSIIILLVYTLARVLGVPRAIAGIAGLGVLYITSGANLPGIWNLIPINLGIVSMLLGLILLAKDELKAFLAVSLLTLLLYPPLVIFITVALCAYFLAKKGLSRDMALPILKYFSLVILAALILTSFFVFNFSDFYKGGSYSEYISSKIFYESFTGEFKPQYAIYNVVPILFLPFILIGLFHSYRKCRWLFSTCVVGLLLWATYALTGFRIIIEYQRVVFVTSILLMVLAGFGLSWILELSKQKRWLGGKEVYDYIPYILLISFLLFLPFYTQRDNWQKLVAKNDAGQVALPAAPANEYLHPDDLRIFQNISNKIFLSLPWKGTVIGVSTDNFPQSTKPGTISIKHKLAHRFLPAKCGRKYRLATRMRLEYVYLPAFNCEHFSEIDKSAEGLYLYKVE